MASGTRSQVKAAGIDLRNEYEVRRDTIAKIRRGEFKVPCAHSGDHARPETLPPAPKGHFEDMLDWGRTYYPTVDEQWPEEIPAGLELCNLEQLKPQLVYPGNRFHIQAGLCDHDVLERVHTLQMMAALHLWRNTKGTEEEYEKIPARARFLYGR